jgi:hypothetical protein
MTRRRLSISQELIGELTVGELELLEERTGRPLSRLFDADAPRGVLLHALAYIALSREEPATSWEDAAEVIVELEGAEVAPAVVPLRAGGKRTG